MWSSLGFTLGHAGASLVAGGIDGAQRKPATYSMSKNQVAQSSESANIYDDTGRSKQTQKVHRLLDQAKLVMAYEQKKMMRQLQKQQTKSKGGKSGTLRQAAKDTFMTGDLGSMNETVFSGATMGHEHDVMNA